MKKYALIPPLAVGCFVYWTVATYAQVTVPSTDQIEALEAQIAALRNQIGQTGEWASRQHGANIKAEADLQAKIDMLAKTLNSKASNADLDMLKAQLVKPMEPQIAPPVEVAPLPKPVIPTKPETKPDAFDLPAGEMSLRIDGVTYRADDCMTAWIDGTAVCVSAPIDGFSFMTFRHPDQQRWVVQYANESLTADDGGSPLVHSAYTAEILMGSDVIATYAIDVHSMGQEWSHVEGRREPIRTPADLVALGDLPRHELPSTQLKPLQTIAPYKPLHVAPLTPFWPAQGGHYEVHWTTDLSHCVLMPSDCAQALENVRLSAENAAGFQLHMRNKDAQHPVDFRDPYYQAASFGPVRWSAPGKSIAFVSNASPQNDEKGQPKFDRGLEPDTAHLACPAWEQFRLDGDPYHLRGLQYCANVAIGHSMSGPRSAGMDGPSLVPARLQSRSYGKGLMMLWRAYEYTPSGDWEWLLPKSYFEQAMKDSAAQAPYLASLPNSAYGKLQQDYLDDRAFDGIEGISHMDMQAIWSPCWVTAKGWPGFKTLCDTLTQGAVDNFTAFGVGMSDFQPWASKQGLKTWGRDYAKAWATYSADTGVTDQARTQVHIWKEQRYEGIASSLAQLGLKAWEPIAKAYRANREYWMTCAPECRGADVMPADWAFAYD